MLNIPNLGPDFKVLFNHFITRVKKVLGVFKINATSSLNFEISHRLSDLLTALDIAAHLHGERSSFSTQPCYVSEFDMCSSVFFPLMAILIHNF